MRLPLQIKGSGSLGFTGLGHSVEDPLPGVRMVLYLKLNKKKCGPSSPGHSWCRGVPLGPSGYSLLIYFLAVLVAVASACDAVY